MIRLPPAERAARAGIIAAGVAAGDSSVVIAARLGLSPQALGTWVARNMPGVKFTVCLEELAERAERGDTAARVAADLRVKPGSIHRRLLRAGRLDVWARLRANERRGAWAA